MLLRKPVTSRTTHNASLVLVCYSSVYWDPPYTVGTGSFPGVKRPERGVDHPPQSSAEVEGRVEVYICPPHWAFVACSRGNVP